MLLRLLGGHHHIRIAQAADLRAGGQMRPYLLKNREDQNVDRHAAVIARYG
jgi:hypothetical protein